MEKIHLVDNLVFNQHSSISSQLCPQRNSLGSSKPLLWPFLGKVRMDVKGRDDNIGGRKKKSTFFLWFLKFVFFKVD